MQDLLPISEFWCETPSDAAVAESFSLFSGTPFLSNDRIARAGDVSRNLWKYMAQLATSTVGQSESCESEEHLDGGNESIETTTTGAGDSLRPSSALIGIQDATSVLQNRLGISCDAEALVPIKIIALQLFKLAELEQRLEVISMTLRALVGEAQRECDSPFEVLRRVSDAVEILFESTSNALDPDSLMPESAQHCIRIVSQGVMDLQVETTSQLRACCVLRLGKRELKRLEGLGRLDMVAILASQRKSSASNQLVSACAKQALSVIGDLGSSLLTETRNTKDTLSALRHELTAIDRAYDSQLIDPKASPKAG